jgi:hypothetical protein
MHPGSRVLWGCSAPPAILPPSPQLCQNGSLSVMSSIGETENSLRGPSQASRAGGGLKSYCFCQEFDGEETSEAVRCRDGTAKVAVSCHSIVRN